MNDPVKDRLDQARESLEEAKALLAGGMDSGFVLTNLYYAFYYPVLALLNEGRVPTTMQNVTLGLFARHFIETGILKKEYSDAIGRVFDGKPKCSGERTAVTGEEAQKLLELAQEFIDEVEAHVSNIGISNVP